jgi:hypothetical protein
MVNWSLVVLGASTAHWSPLWRTKVLEEIVEFVKAPAVALSRAHVPRLANLGTKLILHVMHNR